jgi:hypothetical protein
MCFNYKVSIFTFLLGVITSILLIFFGNKKYKTENMVFGISFIYISLMQLIDFLFWIDLDNKKGINKITTIIAPLVNVGQPTFFYLIKNIFYKRTNIITSISYLLANVIYFIYLLKNYFKFLNNNILITSVEKKHLKWQWIEYFSDPFYVTLLALNIFYLSNFKYSLIVFLITYFFLLISYKYFNYHIGEIWCFFGVSIPILILLGSYLI